MITILKAIQANFTAGKPVVLANVAMSSGATPRSEGAHMVVAADGLQAGTIGGGNVEFRAIAKARELLADGRSDSHNYVLNRSDVEDLGMICGGDVVVRFLFLPPDDRALQTALTEGIAALADRQPVMLVTGLHDTSAVFLLKIGDRLVGRTAGLDAAVILAELQKSHGRRMTLSHGLIAEAMLRTGRAVIFGGGHVGMALAHALTPLDFAVSVLDDRTEFVEADRYPAGTETALIDLTDIAASFEVRPDDFVCIMTRGHRFDQIVQAQILKTEACYIGVIGSKHKARTVFANLKNEYGFSDEALARITTPIGLDILAETPEEIAVSIAAQLIQVRAEREKELTP